MSEEKKKGRGGARPGAGRKPTGRGKSTTIRLSSASVEKLRRIASPENKTIREVVENLIKEAVE